MSYSYLSRNLLYVAAAEIKAVGPGPQSETSRDEKTAHVIYYDCKNDFCSKKIIYTQSLRGTGWIVGIRCVD